LVEEDKEEKKEMEAGSSEDSSESYEKRRCFPDANDE
jgi:hypothetical protein